MSRRNSGVGVLPDWFQEYDIFGKVGEGTYGLVYLATKKDGKKGSNQVAIKKIKHSKEGDGVSVTAIREIMLLKECNHENVVKLAKVHIDHNEMSLFLVFDYAEYDLYELIRYHREKFQEPISTYTVKSIMWQILNGMHYLHKNWIFHRDLKPSNILVMGTEHAEAGIVKIGDFGLARFFLDPLRPLSDNGVVVTIWYRAPEILLGSKHYTCAVDIWSIGCIFAELLLLKPLFQGMENKSQNSFQVDQMEKINRVLGPPSPESWPLIQNLPFWSHLRQYMMPRNYDGVSLAGHMNLPAGSLELDLLEKMLDYDPAKRITAEEALCHEYFNVDPLPGMNSLVPSSSTIKTVAYPRRFVDTSSENSMPSSDKGNSASKSGNARSQGNQQARTRSVTKTRLTYQ